MAFSYSQFFQKIKINKKFDLTTPVEFCQIFRSVFGQLSLRFTDL